MLHKVLLGFVGWMKREWVDNSGSARGAAGGGDQHKSCGSGPVEDAFHKISKLRQDWAGSTPRIRGGSGGR